MNSRGTYTELIELILAGVIVLTAYYFIVIF